MTSIPILNGIYSDTNANYRNRYPRNLHPVLLKQGISQGYLKPADGIIEFKNAIDKVNSQSSVYLNKLISQNGLFNQIISVNISPLGLVKSYTVPTTDPLYFHFNGRCFLYDQSLAVFAACSINDQVLASTLIGGIIASFDANANKIYVSVNPTIGIAYEAHIRTDVIGMVLYALSFFAAKYPSDANHAAAITRINLIEPLLMTYQDLTPGGLQHNCILGGKGQFSSDYSTFDPNYIIPWTSSAGNIICAFALYQAWQTTGNILYGGDFSNVLNALSNSSFGFYDQTTLRIDRGLTSTVRDSSDSLDIHSLLYLLQKPSVGHDDFTDFIYSEIELFKTTDPINSIIGYKPYITSRGGPYDDGRVWAEGTFQVVLAKLAHGNIEESSYLYSSMMSIADNNGIKLSTIRDYDYQLKDWYGISSLCWSILSIIPNGFMNVTDTGLFNLVSSANFSPGKDRGGINWNGTLYRVMGSKLCRIESDGTKTIVGDVGGTSDPVTITYSFDRLAICSEAKLYYFDGNSVIHVNDPDLGDALDVIWIDGYFMTTDGTNIVVTELNDPMSVNPLKYGSSEANPDPIKGLLKFRGEAYALNRYTIEVFNNVGGQFFPFQRVDGALLPLGVIGTNAACVFGKEVIAVLGGGENEPVSVYFVLNGTHTNISTREIDTILQEYTEYQLENAYLECRVDKSQELLYIHLPDQTLVYDAKSSKEAGEPVWFILTSSLTEKGTYRARYLVWAYNKWIVGDITTEKLGYLTETESNHYGSENGWEFGTTIIYNEGKGVLFHELELMVLSGHIENGKNPTVWTAYSTDGETWSREFPRTAGKIGNRNVRLNWLQQGNMRNYRIQKFRGTSAAHISIAKLEARLEPLND